MDTINTIIQNSAVGLLSKKYQHLIVFLFFTIALTLVSMLWYISNNAHSLKVSFGY